MATYAQLQAESWWGREIVTPELDWLGDELCQRTKRPRAAAGTKGDNHHLSGGHRSQEWILKSRYSTNRTYTVQSGLTATQARHVAAFDFTPGSASQMIAQSKRLIAAMKAGQLDEVRAVYGNVDGDKVVDGWDNVRDRAASSDSSHLWHWHLTLDRRHCANKKLMERILAIALGEDDDMAMTEAQLQRAVHNTRIGNTGVTFAQVLDPLRFAPAKLDAILAAVADELDVEAINTTIREEGEKTRTALVGVRDAILAELPDEGPVSREDVEAAFRTVLGSVDDIPASG